MWTKEIKGKVMVFSVTNTVGNTYKIELYWADKPEVRREQECTGKPSKEYVESLVDMWDRLTVVTVVED